MLSWVTAKKLKQGRIQFYLESGEDRFHKALHCDARVFFKHVIQIGSNIANLHWMLSTLAQHSGQHIGCKTLIHHFIHTRTFTVFLR